MRTCRTLIRRQSPRPNGGRPLTSVLIRKSEAARNPGSQRYGSDAAKNPSSFLQITGNDADEIPDGYKRNCEKAQSDPYFREMESAHSPLPRTWGSRQRAVVNDGLGNSKHVPTVRDCHLALLDEQIHQQATAAPTYNTGCVGGFVCTHSMPGSTAAEAI